MKNYYYNKVIWTHLAACSDLFNNMSVLAYDSNGKAVGSKMVPITLGPKEKVVASLLADNPDDPTSVFSPDNYLPRLSLTWTGLSRDSARQRGQHEKRRILVEYDTEDPTDTTARVDCQTVPWILNLELTIWTKYMDDMAQLLENILPFFHPEAPVSLFERGVGTERQTKLTLDSVSPNFVVELSESDRRVLQANLTFSMEMNFYKPEKPIEKPIRRVTVRVGADTTSSVINKLGIPVANEATSDGDVISSILAPCVSGSNNWLDLDNQITSIIQEFDGDLERYMADTYHNELVPEAPVEPLVPTPPNPNENPTDDLLYGITYEEKSWLINGYNYTIPPLYYEKQAFVPDDGVATFTWTVETSGTSTMNGEDGILYEGGMPADTSDVSGDYIIPKESIFCENIDPSGGACP